MNTMTFTAAAAALVALGAAPAAAQEPKSETVEYADLDLRTAEGMEALDNRLRRAISRVCYNPDARSSQQLRAVRACRRELTHKSGQLVDGLARGTVTIAGGITIRVDG